ncbi:MAG TPA: flagellar motor switch protein FliN [Geminicoccus sp.]|uniref:flagellar motor switch protein FliN n=1 Tax=Geminicoccus sp. TaxID=2024832 RepID=UPI002D032C26|nr:flagellar motor switch protein FliN [Geminicoccus sp.]HWL71552.1 flagellar motor switch protein FliN [Geminicoccus sp.]
MTSRTLPLDSFEPTQEEPGAEPRPGIVSPAPLGAVYDIPVQLSAVLGKASMPLNQLLRLGRGAVVELDRKVGEPIDIFVNNRLVARGEVIVVEDRLGVTMTEIIKGEH